MNEVIPIGLDTAKNVFQVHGVDYAGDVVIRRQLRRRRVRPFFKKLPGCLVGIEACATAHHWGRQLIGLGHEVKLMPPHYGRPYVKRGKNDAADAEAICEAVTRPTMRFVAVKGREQQGVLMLHRTPELSPSKHEFRDNQSTFPRSRITRLPPRLAGRRDFETKPAVGLAQGRLGGGGIVGPGEDEA